VAAAVDPLPEMVGVPPPPIFPKTPNPNNNPKIKAKRAKIPNKGHNHLGHPPSFFLVLVSLAVSGTVAPTVA
jgi:hypothetical protein